MNKRTADLAGSIDLRARRYAGRYRRSRFRPPGKCCNRNRSGKLKRRGQWIEKGSVPIPFLLMGEVPPISPLPLGALHQKPKVIKAGSTTGAFRLPFIKLEEMRQSNAQ